MQSLITVGERSFVFTYSSFPENFDRYMLVLEKMLQTFSPISNSVTNSTHSNFLTYQDTVNGFKIQYPSDWNKTNYPPNIPVVIFMSPAQNATDNLFENLGVVIELLPMQNITLDQYSHGAIEQLGLESPDFNVTSPPNETMLGGVPAYNMTYTDIRTDENDTSVGTVRLGL